MSQRVHLRIRRSDGWEDFHVTVREGGSVLDALEAAWRKDHSLLFRHSCHHGSCGTCGMRINGRESMACLTPVEKVARGDRPVILEPLRNLPLIGGLLVDLGPVARGIEDVGLPILREVERSDDDGVSGRSPHRYEDCIECGMCVSVCPIAGSDPKFLGPAALAAGSRVTEPHESPEASPIVERLGGEHGVWRCHGVFECSDVCPAQVDPAAGIFRARRRILEGSARGHSI